MLRSIQLLRAIAVLQVMALHSQIIVGENAWIMLPLFTDYGWLGVRLFFVISGFVIAHSIAGQRNFFTFIARRYLRVLPLYLIATLIAIYALFVDLGVTFHDLRNDAGQPAEVADPNLWIILSLLILPQDVWPVFMVGWSLELEILFYLAFGALYFTLGRRSAVLGLALLTVGVHLVSFAGDAGLQSSFPYFLAGVVAHSAWKASRSLDLRLLGPVAAVLFLAMAAHLYLPGHLPPEVFLPANALLFGIVVFLAADEGYDPPAGSGTNWLVRLGDASFAAYLVHWLVFAIVIAATASMRQTAASDVTTSLLLEAIRIGAFALALWLSFWVHERVEKPINALVRRLVR